MPKRQFKRKQTNNIRTSYAYKPDDAIRDDERIVYRNLLIVFILVVGFSGILYLWGIDIVVGLSDFWRGVLPSQKIVTLDGSEPTIALASPRLDPLPLFINEQSIDIKGWAQPGFDVEIFINDTSVASVLVDKNGRFEYTATKLANGENTVYAVTAKNDTKSTNSETARVTYDTTAPIIEIQSYTAATEPPFVSPISGSVTEKSTITINEQRVILQPDNTFTHTQALTPGTNTVTVKAIDLAGNETTKELTIIVEDLTPEPQPTGE